MTTRTLGELAKTIRSKNAGTDLITFDVIFPSDEVYQQVKSSGSLTRDTVATLFSIDSSRIVDFVNFDPAFAVKFTVARAAPSGSPGESDIFGCQQYPPLLDVPVVLADD